MGHASTDVWSYTPRRISAFLWFASERRRKELAEQLAIATNAARGDPKQVKKMITAMSKD